MEIFTIFTNVWNSKKPLMCATRVKQTDLEKRFPGDALDCVTKKKGSGDKPMSRTEKTNQPIQKETLS